MICLELFSGSGNIGRSFERSGFEVISVDNRKRKGICEPTLQLDIEKVPRTYFSGTKISVVWAAIPCTAYSRAAGDYYYSGRVPRLNAIGYIKLLKKSLDLIEEINPDFYFIENPTGRMRYEKLMIDFLSRSSGTIKYCTLGSYGFPTPKPTDIFTNCYQWQPRTPIPFGRGYKSDNDFNNLTVVKRQTTPAELGNEVAEICARLLNIPGPSENSRVLPAGKYQDLKSRPVII